MMKKISKTIWSLSCLTAFSFSAYGAETPIDQAELQVFAAQKFRVDFNAQTEKSKTDITNEYMRNTKLGDALLAGAIKDDIHFKIAQRQIAIEIWAQKFLKNTTVEDATIKALYEQYHPKMTAAYKLRNILVKTESKADSMIKTLSGIKDPAKRLEKFKELVKSDSEDVVSRKNEGDAGWLDLNRFDQSTQTALKDKKNNDLLKAQIKDAGWQVLLIEDHKPERPATYDEAKGQLGMSAKQELLRQEIKKILDKQ